MKTLLTTLATIIVFIGYCQDVDQSKVDLANEYSTIAARLGNNNQVDSSRYYYELSITEFRKLSKGKGDFWYKEVLNLSEDLVQLTYRTGDLKTALSGIDTIVSEVKKYYPDTELHANVLKVKGIVFIRMGNYDSTVYYYKKSLEVANKIPDFPQRPLGYTLNNLGHVYFRLRPVRFEPGLS